MADKSYQHSCHLILDPAFDSTPSLFGVCITGFCIKNILDKRFKKWSLCWAGIKSMRGAGCRLMIRHRWWDWQSILSM